MMRTLMSATFPILLGLLLLTGCRGPMEGLAGDYESEGQGRATARLSLHEDGRGALSVGAEEAPFRWEVREEGRLVLHTRQGGSLLVLRSANALELNMPGAGKLIFRKKAP